MAGLMRELNEMLGIQTKLSMAFYLQTDRQTERMNQELEQYLRMFIDHCQEQWPEWLGTAEFAYNNKAHSSTNVINRSFYQVLYHYSFPFLYLSFLFIA